MIFLFPRRIQSLVQAPQSTTPRREEIRFREEFEAWLHNAAPVRENAVELARLDTHPLDNSIPNGIPRSRWQDGAASKVEVTRRSNVLGITSKDIAAIDLTAHHPIHACPGMIATIARVGCNRTREVRGEDNGHIVPSVLVLELLHKQVQPSIQRGKLLSKVAFQAEMVVPSSEFPAPNESEIR